MIPLVPSSHSSDIPARFWAKVEFTGTCWLWTGSHDTNTGHGRFWINGKPYCAHRVSWTMAYGQIPDGMEVLHRCDIGACVKPGDLFLGTQQDNILDAIRKNRFGHAGRHNAIKTHCPEGHPYAGDNLIINKKGSRVCRECANAAKREYNNRIYKERFRSL